MTSKKSNQYISESKMNTDETTKRFLDLVSNVQSPTEDQNKKIIKQEYDNMIKYIDNLEKFDKYLAYRYITQKIDEIKKNIIIIYIITF